MSECSKCVASGNELIVRIYFFASVTLFSPIGYTHG